MNWDKLLNNYRLRESTRGKDTRNDFESDFGRIIFSSALRRMHDKTQVFPLTTDDNIHSRLTHSMEVMAIGHSLGIKICDDKDFVEKTKRDPNYLYREIPIILKNACLIHDIGNPPFGHFGETAIQTYFSNCDKAEFKNLTIEEQEDFTLFDGNAQGFRVLTKLQILNDEYGLNLTTSTLAAYLKYPNCRSKNKKIIHKRKRGVFQSEQNYLKEVANQCGLEIKENIVRHPLCYLTEAADSICYLVMDIEDGFNKGWYQFESVLNEIEEIKILNEAISKIRKENSGVRENITRMVKFRIYLISYLVDLAIANFLKNYDLILKGEYNKELIFDDDNKVAELLQKFCIEHIFPSREITSLELTGHSVISGLLDIYIKFVFHQDEAYRKRASGLISDSIKRIAIEENREHIISERIKKLENDSRSDEKKKEKLDKIKKLRKELNQLEILLEEKTSEHQKIKDEKRGILQNLNEEINPTIDDLPNYYKFRLIVDYISGMTDQFALSQYQKLSGQKIS